MAIKALITGLLAVAVATSAWLFAPAGTFIVSCLFGWTLLALALIDLRTLILPDPLNLLAALLGIVMIATTRPHAWLDHLIGAAAGYLLLFGLEHLYRLLRKKDGLGRGDAKLLAVLGLWTGWMQLPDILLIASLAGMIAAIALSCFSRSKLSGATAIAFGPWLALAGWTSWLAGPLLAPAY